MSTENHEEMITEKQLDTKLEAMGNNISHELKLLAQGQASMREQMSTMKWVIGFGVGFQIVVFGTLINMAIEVGQKILGS